LVHQGAPAPVAGSPASGSGAVRTKSSKRDAKVAAWLQTQQQQESPVPPGSSGSGRPARTVSIKDIVQDLEQI
jgi:hypothetical protein